MATFFQDASGEIRLIGTLYSPGATTGNVLTVQSNGSLAPAAGGGSQTVKMLSFVVPYTDFVAIDPGVDAQALVYTLPLDEILIAAVFRITETFDDSGGGGFVIETVGNGLGLSETYGPAKNTPIDGLVGLIHDDTSGLAAISTGSMMQPDTAPVDIYVYAGSFAGDGATGSLTVSLLIGVVAP